MDLFNVIFVQIESLSSMFVKFITVVPKATNLRQFCHPMSESPCVSIPFLSERKDMLMRKTWPRRRKFCPRAVLVEVDVP